jgi:N-formylglutamate amidohydrolase
MIQDPPYILHPAQGESVPIIISSPHSGTQFPDHLKHQYHPCWLTQPVDTDWYINKLYDFAPALGITLIEARYSRYLIDLNRNPENRALYTDGRYQSGLLPLQTFAGKKIYLPGFSPSEKETQERLTLYYWPYYHQVKLIIKQLKEKFDHVLFFDAHSIKHSIPAISAQPFPAFILGDNHQQASSPALTFQALCTLQAQTQFSVSHNHPFTGGHLTRYFGAYLAGVHALQLEMCQCNYMDEISLNYDRGKSQVVIKLLKKLFFQLISTLKAMQ